MKTFWDLTDEEVSKLSFETINRYVDVACAEEGVALMPDCPIEPKLEKPVMDSWYYSIGDFKVGSPEEATILLEALSKVNLLNVTYDYGCGYDNQYIQGSKEEVPEIKKKAVFSNSTFSAMKLNLQKYTDLKKRYESELKSYRDADSKRQKVSEQILKKVEEVRDDYYSRDQLTKEFARYLDLAEGDKNIAMKFFTKTYADEVGDLSDGEAFKNSLMQ